jgi:hypothetical protein
MLTTHPLRSTAAITLALAAICAPAASARPIQADPPQGTQTATNVTPVVRVIAPAGGFDWGDAGIGAAGGFALSMLGVGGAIAISRRDRSPRGTSAISG